MSDKCPICKGLGWLTYDVPLDDPRSGKLVPCPCRQEEMTARQYQEMRQRSQLSGRLLEKTFDGFRAKTPAQRQCLAAAQAYAQQPTGWLVLIGPNGDGKTHLAAAIANARLAAGQPVLFVVVPDMLDHLRQTFAPQSEVRFDELFEQVRTHPLLILDDMGAESSTAWAAEKLFQIVNHRYVQVLPTVITSNVAQSQFAPRLGVRIGDGEVSRIYRTDEAMPEPVRSRTQQQVGKLARSLTERY